MSTPAPPRNYAPHTRMVLSGTLGALGGSPERFTTSLSLDGFGDAFFTSQAARQQDMVADAKAFWADPRNGIASRAKLDLVKFASIGVDGRYTRDPLIFEFAGVGGTAIGVDHPFQCSFAVTLESARRGPSGKGRMFLPLPVFSIDGGGLISGANALDVATSVAAFLNNIQNSPGFDGSGASVVIASSKGFLSPVIGVRAGRVVDTIRSRRTSLVEAYSAPVAVT